MIVSGACSILKRRLWLCLLLAGLAAGLTASEKNRNWQTGKLLDIEMSRVFAGMQGSAEDYSHTATYRVYETLTIEGDSHIYVARRGLRWRWSKSLDLAVNASVKFAVEKRKLFVIDEDGKEHELSITKRVLKPPTPPDAR